MRSMGAAKNLSLITMMSDLAYQDRYQEQCENLPRSVYGLYIERKGQQIRMTMYVRSEYLRV
jgi:hypothetical protein